MRVIKNPQALRNNGTKGEVMMKLDVDTIKPADKQRLLDRRRSPRHPVRIRALLHGSCSFQSTTINDLSVDGARVDGANGVYPGDAVEIELMDSRKIPGKVAWWLMGACGIQFSEPLPDDDPLWIETSR
jgi:PilZ domain